MSRLTFIEYVRSLTEELGPHYTVSIHPQENWLGFIYCECYDGKGFPLLKGGKREFPIYRPMVSIGAVARITKNDSIVLLDHRQSYTRDGRNIRGHHEDGGSDSTMIHLAQPDFHEQFMHMRDIHEAMMDYFGIKWSSYQDINE